MGKVSDQGPGSGCSGRRQPDAHDRAYPWGCETALRLLLTNDDGIWAQGLRQLARALAGTGDVTVVAPERERSAMGHAITMHKPLRVNPVPDWLPGVEGVRAFTVNGTPSDCVKIGAQALVDRLPDCLLSGINRGPNLGMDIFYSGTVSAAVEGLLLGIPAIALSLNVSGTASQAPGPDSYQKAAAFGRMLCRQVVERGLPQRVFLNVNVPFGPVQGVRITRVGARRYHDVLEERRDLQGRSYYWLGGELVDADQDPASDSVAVRQGYISVSPVRFDLSPPELQELLRSWDLRLPSAGDGRA